MTYFIKCRKQIISIFNLKYYYLNALSLIKHTMTNKEITSWNDIENIKSDLLRGIYSMGFENPSPIQQKAILPALEKKDLIAQAQSGTGKTGSFTCLLYTSDAADE